MGGSSDDALASGSEARQALAVIDCEGMLEITQAAIGFAMVAQS
jgi:hypothetical protein